VNHVTGGFTRI